MSPSKFCNDGYVEIIEICCSFLGKYPIPTAKAEQPADVYDRITQNDSFVETNYQTREDESVPLDNR